MKLLVAGPSPFVRKVRVLILETGQQDAIEQVDVVANPAEPDSTLVAANPAGKIPALIRDDGPAIFDSRVICRFLDARVDAGLYPQARLWETLTLEASADALMDAAVLMVYEQRFRSEGERSQAWLDGQSAKVERSLSAVNSRWISHLSGPLDMSHIAMGCALGYLDLRQPENDWRSRFDGLAAWFETFNARPSMQQTLFSD
ncbi:glutathione S-transferase [Algirhabdus cladophorae]|uniref:glutathione S-transferase n=1 Tax=Algirhabdus cladophorae TaxID=3377108 RepID=UPI003B847DFA